MAQPPETPLPAPHTFAPPAPLSQPLQQHRPGGTVYGGPTGRPTSANPDAPIDASGSLTGLILSRGAPAQIQPAEEKSRLAKVLIVGLTSIAFITVISILVAVLAGDVISAVFRGLFG
jgi:hypothetical protein